MYVGVREQIMKQKDKVHWCKVVWFSHGIPLCSFITSLAVEHRLATIDRMRTWGSEQACISYGELNEKRDHLFFVCSTYTVWLELGRTLLGNAANPDWAEMLEFLTQLLLELFITFGERNSQRQRTIWAAILQLCRFINRVMHNPIVSLHHHFPHKLKSLL
ncbi:unnamed protein product, partial [Thlaspi arvense]